VSISGREPAAASWREQAHVESGEGQDTVVEIIGMVGTRDASEIKGPLVDGPVVDWTDGPVIDTGYLTEISRVHEAAGFDRVLVGYGSVGPEGWAVASHVLAVTRTLGVLVAHRPGPVQPVLLARQAATVDHLSGGGRVAVHFITGGDEQDQRREGDFVPHDDRYRRTREAMALVRRIWSADEPFDHTGPYYRYEHAFSSVKPVSPGGIPLYFAGASAPAIPVGAEQADVYAFWAEPLAAVAERIARIDGLAGRYGRTMRYSISLRPIIAPTESQAWERAAWIAETATRRIDEARQALSTGSTTGGLGGTGATTYAIARNDAVTTSTGRRRLIGLAASGEVHDERLWTRIAGLTGGAGNSTALVGTPDQVAEAMLRYCDLGVTTLLLRGFDPVADAVAFGEELLPRLRAGAHHRTLPRPDVSVGS